VWLSKEEEMLDFDDNKHGHLPLEEWPPNNIRLRKIYRQMTIFMNNGPLDKGVHKNSYQSVLKMVALPVSLPLSSWVTRNPNPIVSRICMLWQTIKN
jgi:hypothetical protein